MLEAWICPRCNKVNAPWVKHCDCDKHKHNNVEPEGAHEWTMSYASSVGVHYRCIHCGATKTVPWQSKNNYINYINGITNE